MTQIKITRVWIGDTETKYGTKQKCAIKCEQMGDVWLSTFKITEGMKSWKEGDTVEVNITKKVTPTGEFYNFEPGFELPKVKTDEGEVDITKEFIF